MPVKINSLENGRAIQVVTPGPGHSFELQLEALSALLLRKDVKNRTAVLVSIAGAYRKGKSFLLNMCLHYLRQKYVSGESGDWLAAEDVSQSGFSSRGGSERVTSGLLLWSQPFKATLSNGEKVVILLMDTQGAYDNQCTMRDNAIVFALSTLLSSVQIYNLSQNIAENDLQALQFFTEYGRQVAETSVGKPFQRLQFVVRDWMSPFEDAYGAAGGQQLLNKRFKVHGSQHEELQEVRRNVTSCFEELKCFLMPYPGEHVATALNFNGKLADINSEFVQSLRELVPMLLAPQNLVPKRIHGAPVKARDLLHYFKTYLNAFKSSELPDPKTMFQATAEANHLSALATARAQYAALMEAGRGGVPRYLSPLRLERKHRGAMAEALRAFRAKPKMGSQELSTSFEAQLVEELEQQFRLLTAHSENSIFRMFSTPAVLAALALLGWVLSALGGLADAPAAVAVGLAVWLASLALVAVWVYSSVTGNLSGVAMFLDIIADTLMGLMNL